MTHHDEDLAGLVQRAGPVRGFEQPVRVPVQQQAQRAQREYDEGPAQAGAQPAAGVAVHFLRGGKSATLQNRRIQCS